MQTSQVPTVSPPVVGCISLEPWDEVWRRNQHLAHQLVAQGLVERIVFIEPPVLGRRGRRFSPEAGIDVVRPLLPLPKRYGGLNACAALLRATVLRGIHVLWVNDPQLGVHCMSRRPAVYDVTDDWRAFDNPPHIRKRIVAAEDRLVRSAHTVVCSLVLADRWRARYAVDTPVVQNAVDVDAFAVAVPRTLLGEAPHIGYVGTLHESRLDLDLCVALARQVGTLHLVGPDSLEEDSRARLRAEPRVVMHGPVPSADVPSWMVSMDVLVCPHLVNEFTLSLDAIKAHEYAASGRPVVATPSSGYQTGLTTAALVEANTFVEAAREAVGTTPASRAVASWAERAVEFVELLDEARQESARLR